MAAPSSLLAGGRLCLALHAAAAAATAAAVNARLLAATEGRDRCQLLYAAHPIPRAPSRAWRERQPKASWPPGPRKQPQGVALTSRQRTKSMQLTPGGRHDRWTAAVLRRRRRRSRGNSTSRPSFLQASLVNLAATVLMYVTTETVDEGATQASAACNHSSPPLSALRCRCRCRCRRHVANRGSAPSNTHIQA